MGPFSSKATFATSAKPRPIIATTLKKCGGVDILVNNAAISERGSLDDFTPEYFEKVISVNLRAPLLLSQAALPSLKKRAGVILNVGSVNSYAGWQKPAGLLGREGRARHRLQEHGERAQVHPGARLLHQPGWIDTEGERAMMKKLGHPDDFMDKEGRTLPIGRLIQPAEVAEVVLFLVSAKAARSAARRSSNSNSFPSAVSPTRKPRSLFMSKKNLLDGKPKVQLSLDLQTMATRCRRRRLPSAPASTGWRSARR